MLYLPTIRIVDPPDPERLLEVTDQERYDWVVFTSANGVRRFFAAARSQVVLRGGPKICAIGAATAGALQSEGATVDLQPDESTGEAVLRSLVREGIAGKRILLPRGDQAGTMLPEGLTRAGAQVTEVVVYHTVAAQFCPPEVELALRSRTVDWITFTSGSTVRAFAALLGTELCGARATSIGPVTSRALLQHGFPVHVEARHQSAAGLVAALIEDSRARPETSG